MVDEVDEDVVDTVDAVEAVVELVEVVVVVVLVVTTAGGAKIISVRSCAVAVSPPPAFNHRISIVGPLEGRYPCVARGIEELIIESS